MGNVEAEICYKGKLSKCCPGMPQWSQVSQISELSLERDTKISKNF